MATFNQLTKNPRRPKRRKSKSPALRGAPFRCGVVTRVAVIAPKKPNSANRVIARVRLSNGEHVTAYVPGERNTLKEHATVLVRGGRVKDLPGVRYHVVRGARDCDGAAGPTPTADPNKVYRNQKRSRYGVKRKKS